MMRVLLVTTYLDRSEVSLFQKLQESGIEIHAICHPDNPSIQEIRDTLTSVVPVVFQSRFQLSAIKLIRTKLESQKFDIVHTLRKPALSNALFALNEQQIRLVAYRGIVGNLSFWDPFSWMTFLNPRIDRVICVAEAIRRFFLDMRFFSFRLDAAKFVTIYKGHDIDWYRTQSVFDRSRLGIENGAILIGCVANMRPRKGIPVLMKAFEQLKHSRSLHLVLVGNVNDSKLLKIYQKSPVKDHIHLMGFRKDAAAIAGNFDLFVLPSLSREGLARSLLEAMAQRVPAVVTDIGGSPEVVEDYGSGRVIPPGDVGALASAIQFCIDDPERLRELGRKAQKRIQEKFNIKNTIRETRTLYEQLVSQNMPTFTN